MRDRPRVWLAGAPAALAAALTVALLARGQATGTAPKPKEGQAEAPIKQPDVIFVPTPQEVVDRMLELAEVKPGDVLYDLGCGDGRIVVTAAKKYGVKAIGFDVDPQRIRESRANVRKNRVDNLVTIKQQDIFATDLREASVVTLYLLPTLNVRLKPQLAKLKPGSRIVSHSFDMRGAKPKIKERVRTPDGRERDVYLWVVPWEEEAAAKSTPGQARGGPGVPPPRRPPAARSGRAPAGG